MTGTADHDAFGHSGWGDKKDWGDKSWEHSPWARPGAGSGGWRDGPWQGPWFAARFGHPHFGNRALWIAMTILAFMAWWPIGLAVLFFLIGSRRMGCWAYGRMGEAARMSRFGPRRFGCGGERTAAPSGNRAFDEYRAETLRRLEEEQTALAAFLDRLRFARDKAEFDAFMTELRERPPAPRDPPAEPAPT